MTVVRRVHRAQRLRHVTANKLTLPLTVLQHLQDGKAVEPRLLAKAIRDLEAIIEWVDGQGKKAR